MDLKLKNVTHRYGPLEVLRDISLDIEHNKIVCLVGPSGCGKSTLLRLLGGLERPSSGEILQIGEASEGSLNALTYVFQHFALLPWRTVEGNIKLALEDHGLSHRDMDDIVTNVLERTRLLEFRKALPKQLSGGMRQRVAISRALAVRPAVMLMDEPLSALDSQTRDVLINDLISLWTHQPFTSVYVTHNLNEAARVGHRIVVLSRRPGRIREIVDIDIPLLERRSGDPMLAEKQEHLWHLMREDASPANSEAFHD